MLSTGCDVRSYFTGIALISTKLFKISIHVFYQYPQNSMLSLVINLQESIDTYKIVWIFIQICYNVFCRKKDFSNLQESHWYSQNCLNIYTDFLSLSQNYVLSVGRQVKYLNCSLLLLEHWDLIYSSVSSLD